MTALAVLMTSGNGSVVAPDKNQRTFVALGTARVVSSNLWPLLGFRYRSYFTYRTDTDQCWACDGSRAAVEGEVGFGFTTNWDWEPGLRRGTAGRRQRGILDPAHIHTATALVIQKQRESA
ncbi:hypothetical protein RB213_003670 [Colletotrichum asianum]